MKTTTFVFYFNKQLSNTDNQVYFGLVFTYQNYTIIIEYMNNIIGEKRGIM